MLIGVLTVLIAAGGALGARELLMSKPASDDPSPRRAGDRAGITGHVYVADAGDASRVLFKPRSWTPTGDGSLRFEDIRWISYDGAIAQATALADASTCEPDCATGRRVKKRVILTLDRPKIYQCAAHTYVYSRIRVRPDLPNRPSIVEFSYCSNRFS